MRIDVTRKTFIAAAACLALLVPPVTASAAFIQGAIGFGGLFTPSGGSGADLSDATGIDIGFSQVTAASGDFVPAIGFNATYQHLDFNPANTPVSPLWTVNTGGTVFSFDLLSIVLDFQDADELNLSGTGTLMATGFDDTAGNWTFSGQQGSIFFTFSSIAGSSAVAEPGMLALLGLGLLGLVATRRLRR